MATPDELRERGDIDAAIAGYMAGLAKENLTREDRVRNLIGIAKCQQAAGKWDASCETLTKVILPLSTSSVRTIDEQQCLVDALRLRIEHHLGRSNALAAAADLEILESASASDADDVRATVSAFAKPDIPKLPQTFTKPYTGCPHYTRKCLIQCPTCTSLTACRFCHNSEEDHELDRFKVTHIQCGDCDEYQPAAACCSKCGIKFSDYYCDICHLWMDIPKDGPQDLVWHCSQCGMCRKGGKSEYSHCNKCNACWSTKLQNHKCNQGGINSCPVCLEDLHSSYEKVDLMNCGHFIHDDCKNKLTESGQLGCPLCKKTISRDSESGSRIATEVAMNPMPSEFASHRATIICNDCLRKSNVPLHFIAMKCPECQSYNTTQTHETVAAGDVDLLATAEAN
eukprot:TRINITY_DN7509_c0_g2_i1.p1 TRINITY_DN7509_c0_g2~~TRINITY_DN7509_c0_g2_i1.p1  ORF type:complete len:398 (+),score=67.81 TRINITY_DN7509_c0_g2_i1:769-1962(+)